jgi:hypothetical protein
VETPLLVPYYNLLAMGLRVHSRGGGRSWSAAWTNAWSELGWEEWLKRCSISFLIRFSHLDLFLWRLRSLLSLPTFRRSHPGSLSSVPCPPLQRIVLKCGEGGESFLEVLDVERSF